MIINSFWSLRIWVVLLFVNYQIHVLISSSQSCIYKVVGHEEVYRILKFSEGCFQRGVCWWWKKASVGYKIPTAIVCVLHAASQSFSSKLFLCTPCMLGGTNTLFVEAFFALSSVKVPFQKLTRMRLGTDVHPCLPGKTLSESLPPSNAAILVPVKKIFLFLEFMFGISA